MKMSIEQPRPFVNLPSSPATDQNSEGDDWLESMLVADGHRQRDSYLTDDGFTARVMGALPQPAALPAWRKPVLTVLWGVGIAGAAIALPDAAYEVARESYRLIVAQSFSLRGVLGAVVAAGALTWGAAMYAVRAAD
jgi:hypothetical protein